MMIMMMMMMTLCGWIMLLLGEKCSTISLKVLSFN